MKKKGFRNTRMDTMYVIISSPYRVVRVKADLTAFGFKKCIIKRSAHLITIVGPRGPFQSAHLYVEWEKFHVYITGRAENSMT